MGDSPPATRITQDFLVDIGGWEVLKQAKAMVAAGRVSAVRYQPPILSAVVQVDGRDLVTRLKIGKGPADVDNLCTCRQAKEDGTICPHVMAAGWAFLQQQEAASAAYAEGQKRQGRHALPQKKVASKQAAPTWKRVLAGSAEARRAKTEPLALTLLLPLTFPDCLQEKATRLILEAGTKSDGVDTSAPPRKSDTPFPRTKPWDAIPKTLEHTFSVSEDDEALLGLLERVHGAGEPPPGMTNFPAKGYALLLRTLDGHPRVWLGKKERLRVIARARKPTLRLTSLDDGGLELELLDDAPTPSAQPQGRVLKLPGSEIAYRYAKATAEQPATLQRVFTLTGPYRALLDGTVTLTADQSGDFLARELPALGRVLDIDDAGLDGRLGFETPTPEIHAVLDGSLAGVTIRLRAKYPHGEFALPPALLDAPAEDSSWEPLPDAALHFWRRHTQAERAALGEVTRRGFETGKRDAGYFFLNKELNVGNFLANVLPRWRQRWTLAYGERFQQLLPRLDYVEPEITLQRDFDASSGEDWLSLDLSPRLAKSGQKADALDPAEIQRWLQTGQSHQRTEGDRVLLLPTAGWQEMQAVLADSQVSRESGEMRLGAAHASGLLETVRAQGWRLSRESDWPPENKAGEVTDTLPAELASLLRPYQKQGIEWLAGLARRRFGGVLADEMGLGKTLQMLGLLQWLTLPEDSGEAKEEKLPALVVCPTSLVDNWAEEAARFTPGLSVLCLHGPDRHQRFSQMAGHDLVVTSYALLRRDLEEYPVKKFAAVVLDEAQHIKNPASQNARAAKALDAAHRFVLTGTPLENSLEDLWSIFDFVMPGYLGDRKAFKERYAAPIARDGDEATQTRLRHRLRPFLLRRTKLEVVRDLPPKLEQVAMVDLSAEQTEVYQRLLEAGRQAVFQGSGKSGRGRHKMAVLTTLLRLRQCVCDLRLLDGKATSPTQWEKPSAKLDLALELLHEAIDGGHRVLVFSQFVSLLALMRERLEEADIAYGYLDGSTRQRAEVVKKFQNDARQSAFLISLKAGGTGLNLTGADTVLHLDPWWNPAVEEQATARAHRIGQENPVTSYKLIARGTVEEKILHLQEKKRDLFTANVTSEELFVENLSWDEIENLLE